MLNIGRYKIHLKLKLRIGTMYCKILSSLMMPAGVMGYLNIASTTSNDYVESVNAPYISSIVEIHQVY